MVISMLVELYEEKQDLIPFLGSEANVSGVLAGEFDLTVPMMRSLHEHLGIPAEIARLGYENASQ
jgi:HTH-type transcriptional regulator / antitoxin HigA